MTITLTKPILTFPCNKSKIEISISLAPAISTALSASIAIYWKLCTSMTPFFRRNGKVIGAVLDTFPDSYLVLQPFSLFSLYFRRRILVLYPDLLQFHPCYQAFPFISNCIDSFFYLWKSLFSDDWTSFAQTTSPKRSTWGREDTRYAIIWGRQW